MFCRLFLLNEMARFVQNGAVSCTVKKKSPKRCRFERHCNLYSSPGHTKQGKKKIFLPSSVIAINLKKTPTRDPLPTQLSMC